MSLKVLDLEAQRGKTHSTELCHLLRKLRALLIGYALKVEDKIGKPRTSLHLPLANTVHLFICGLVGARVRRPLRGTRRGPRRISVHNASAGPLANRGSYWALDAVLNHLSLCGRRLTVGFLAKNLDVSPDLL